MTRVALVDDQELALGIEPVHSPPSPLALTNADVSRMTRPQREDRLADLIADSRRIFTEAVQRHVTDAGREVAGVVSLFSGGNDSTTTTHLFRDVATHAGHANTTVGIESTRQFVRDTCKLWGLPLLERMPPRLGDRYAALVLSTEYDDKGRPMGGFPGPSLHWKMYQRLKHRAIEAMQQEVVTGRGHTHRVVFIAGRRRDESKRRESIPESEQRRSRVWVSPMVHWTKLDLNTYRLAHPGIPRNLASDLIHMSGECLCGSYAHPGERAELEHWFNGDLDHIRWLEAELRKPAFDFIPDYRKTWGWAGIPELRAQAPKADLVAKAAGLCQSCNDPMQMGLFDLDEPTM